MNKVGRALKSVRFFLCWIRGILILRIMKIRYFFLLVFLLHSSWSHTQNDFTTFLKKIQNRQNLNPEEKARFKDHFPQSFGALEEVYFTGEKVIKKAGLTYVICQLNDPAGLCSVNLISTFSEKQTVFQQALFNLLCQEDELSEFFQGSEYSLHNNNLIEIRRQDFVNKDLPENENEKDGPVYYRYFFLSDTGFYYYHNIDHDPYTSDPEKLDYRVYTQDMLKGYSASELRILRNSIFARHGYRFKSPDLQSHFLAQSWYKEGAKTQEDILSELNPIERANIQVIQAVEKTNK